MPSLRRTATMPGLARLLADAPRDRRGALAAYWGVGSPDQPGFVAILYRAMTDRGQVHLVLDRCSEVERRLFASLLPASLGRAPVDLATHLPFSEPAIEEGLQSLEARGLAWKMTVPGQGRDADGARWVVPRDLAAGLGRDWSRARANGDDQPGQVASGLALPPVQVDRVSLPAPVVHPGGAIRQGLTILVDRGTSADGLVRSGLSAGELRAWGVALGILTPNHGSIAQGARAQAWTGLDARAQTRALARLWLVNQSVSRGVPITSRSAVAAVLATLDQDVWYGFDSFARVVASRVTERSLRRAELEEAVVTLTSLGVLDVAVDERQRPAAIRLSEAGKYALT